MVNFSPITAIGAYTGILPSQQMWAYDMYPSWTPASIAYPSDSLSIQNDKKLYQFDVQSDALVRQAAMLEANLAPMAQQWQAQVAQWYNNTMQSLNSNMSWNFNNNPSASGLDFSSNGFGLSNGVGNNPWMPGMNIGNVNNNNNNNSKEMDDKDVWKYMSRTGSIDTYGEKLLEKVKLKDGTEKSYVERLVALAKDFVTAEDTELSDSEFAQLKEIATKMRDNKPITKEDFLTLKEIVKNHRGEIDGKKDNTDKVDDDEENENESDGTKALPDKYRHEYELAASGAPNSYTVISEEFRSALYDHDANEEDLAQITKKVDKYNVLNIAKDFEKNYGSSYDENIVDAIFGDTTTWGYHDWLTNGMSDNAKPSVTAISNALISRTKDIIKQNPKMDKETKNELLSLCRNLNKSINRNDATGFGWVTFNDMKSEFKKEVSENFQALTDKLSEVENDIYGEVEL